MSVSSARFERTAAHPVPADDFEGVLLRAPERFVAGQPCVVRGAFQIGPDALATLPREDAYDALTLLVTERASARSTTVRPARSAVALATEPGPAGRRRGWFELDVIGMSGFRPRAGTITVSAWLGPLRSEGHDVIVEAPPETTGGHR
ncbi:MAG: hypothetical protein U0704_12525 [Candidatus Eisenbacteria bacterium]